MIFGNKRLLEIQESVINNQAKKINDLKVSSDYYQWTLKNVQEFQSRNVIGLDLYSHNGNLYYIFADNIDKTPFGNRILEYDLLTSQVNSTLNYCEWITKAQIEIFEQDNDTELEIVNLDTRIEERQGHASKQVKTIVSYAKMFRMKKIFGKLFDQTPIGLENLKNFYRKNGFEVGNTSFWMNM